jgi:hypothetical protein
LIRGRAELLPTGRTTDPSTLFEMTWEEDSSELRVGREEQQVLHRMTIPSQESTTVTLHLLRPLQNFHPDRSEAQWRDLLFLLGDEALLSR